MSHLRQLAQSSLFFLKPLALNQLQKSKWVLTYHHIDKDVGYDPFLLSVSESHFEEQLEYLKNNFKIHPLKRLLDANCPSGVALTFDDGNLDNFDVALPILERHQVPATFFIGSSYLGQGPYWWEELSHLFSRAPLNSPLDLSESGLPPELSRPAFPSAHHKKHYLYQLTDHLKPLSGQDRTHILCKLKTHPSLWTETLERRVVNLETLQKFRKHPLITLQAQ